MALDARDRSSIYTKLVPLLGEDDANALMSQFPGSDADELTTRQFLRAELAGLRTELHDEISALRTELHAEIGALRTELHTEISGLRAELHTEIGGLRAEVADRLRAQTAWMVGAILASVGLTTTITAALG